ncbi:hypothetical protein KLP28_08845 [Nocardioidaceae bacterium]|nr:hypothetical protein KLP28_08845 [Nocardioidaceae bacterium]
MSTSSYPSEYAFAFSRRYRVAALPFGVTARTSGVRLDPDGLHVRFGPWRLHSELENLRSVSLTGDFSFARAAGPPRFLTGDRGVAFTPNGDAAVRVRFRASVPCLDPTGLVWPLRHTAAVLGVADVADFLGRADELGLAVE